MIRKIIISAIAVVFVTVFTFTAALTVAKQENKGNSEKSQNVNKLENQLKRQNKQEVKTSAQSHKFNTDLVVNNLKEVAKEEKKAEQEQKKVEKKIQVQEEEMTQEQIAGELEEIAGTEDEAEEEVTEAISKVEKRGKLKTFFIGTDYKNMGQLRSELVRNRNQIRQLTRLANKVEGEDNKLTLENQIATMLQEREGIYNLIKDNEEKFSLLGWVVRFLTGYPAEPITEQADEEEQLIEEVEEALLGNEEGNGGEEDETTDETETDTDATGTVGDEGSI